MNNKNDKDKAKKVFMAFVAITAFAAAEIMLIYVLMRNMGLA